MEGQFFVEISPTPFNYRQDHRIPWQDPPTTDWRIWGITFPAYMCMVGPRGGSELASRVNEVVFNIIMSVRQAWAIQISCFIFQHTLNRVAIFGFVVVFTGVFGHTDQRRRFRRGRARVRSEREKEKEMKGSGDKEHENGGVSAAWE